MPNFQRYSKGLGSYQLFENYWCLERCCTNRDLNQHGKRPGHRTSLRLLLRLDLLRNTGPEATRHTVGRYLLTWNLEGWLDRHPRVTYLLLISPQKALSISAASCWSDTKNSVNPGCLIQTSTSSINRANVMIRIIIGTWSCWVRRFQNTRTREGWRWRWFVLHRQPFFGAPSQHIRLPDGRQQNYARRFDGWEEATQNEKRWRSGGRQVPSRVLRIEVSSFDVNDHRDDRRKKKLELRSR